MIIISLLKICENISTFWQLLRIYTDSDFFTQWSRTNLSGESSIILCLISSGVRIMRKYGKYSLLIVANFQDKSFHRNSETSEVIILFFFHRIRTILTQFQVIFVLFMSLKWFYLILYYKRKVDVRLMMMMMISLFVYSLYISILQWLSKLIFDISWFWS